MIVSKTGITGHLHRHHHQKAVIDFTTVTIRPPVLQKNKRLATLDTTRAVFVMRMVILTRIISQMPVKYLDVKKSVTISMQLHVITYRVLSVARQAKLVGTVVCMWGCLQFQVKECT